MIKISRLIRKAEITVPSNRLLDVNLCDMHKCINGLLGPVI